MEKNMITLLARNEAGEPFNVTFVRDEGKLTITCNCPAGTHGEFCEHKFRLASNDLMMLKHPGQNSEMLSAHLWVIESPLSDRLLHLFELLGADEENEEAISKAQQEIGQVMREGTVSGT